MLGFNSCITNFHSDEIAFTEIRHQNQKKTMRKGILIIQNEILTVRSEDLTVRSEPFSMRNEE
jgi:hypothetical protein